MRLLAAPRAALLALLAAALLAQSAVTAASDTAGDADRTDVTVVRIVGPDDVPPAANDGDADVAYCCPLSGIVPAVGWYARSFRARSWREFLLPFAGRGEAECP